MHPKNGKKIDNCNQDVRLEQNGLVVHLKSIRWLISWYPKFNAYDNHTDGDKDKGRVALPKRMNFQKSSNGEGGVIFNKKILQIVDLYTEL